MNFESFEMMFNYEQRVVAHYECDNLVVDTAAVTDVSGFGFETAIRHPSYKGGEWVVVAQYETRDAAEKGHGEWVTKMTAQKLPAEIKDVSTCVMAQIAFDSDDDPARVFARRRHD